MIYKYIFQVVQMLFRAILSLLSIPGGLINNVRAHAGAPTGEAMPPPNQRGSVRGVPMSEAESAGAKWTYCFGL